MIRIKGLIIEWNELMIKWNDFVFPLQFQSETSKVKIKAQPLEGFAFSGLPDGKFS